MLCVSTLTCGNLSSRGCPLAFTFHSPSSVVASILDLAVSQELVVRLGRMFGIPGPGYRWHALHTCADLTTERSLRLSTQGCVLDPLLVGCRTSCTRGTCAGSPPWQMLPPCKDCASTYCSWTPPTPPPSTRTPLRCPFVMPLCMSVQALASCLASCLSSTNLVVQPEL